MLCPQLPTFVSLNHPLTIMVFHFQFWGLKWTCLYSQEGNLRSSNSILKKTAWKYFQKNYKKGVFYSTTLSSEGSLNFKTRVPNFIECWNYYCSVDICGWFLFLFVYPLLYSHMRTKKCVCVLAIKLPRVLIYIFIYVYIWMWWLLKHSWFFLCCV